jgi:hypothetical protein
MSVKHKYDLISVPLHFFLLSINSHLGQLFSNVGEALGTPIIFMVDKYIKN